MADDTTTRALAAVAAMRERANAALASRPADRRGIAGDVPALCDAAEALARLVAACHAVAESEAFARLVSRAADCGERYDGPQVTGELDAALAALAALAAVAAVAAVAP